MTGRYQRQIQLRDFGPAGQDALAASNVLIIGAGGLGVPVATYLNAMGVGRIGIVDGDYIETSNLHRQPAYNPQMVGNSKVKMLGLLLKEQNPGTSLEIYDTYLNPANAIDLLKTYDLVVDATDNLPTRYLLDDACLIQGIPWVYGALHGFEGQVSVFNYKGGPTYRCLFPTAPGAGEIPDCNSMGTLGVLPGIVGNLQALEVIKVLCNLKGVLSGKLLMYDALDQLMHQITFEKDPVRQHAKLRDSYLPGCNNDTGRVSWESYFENRRLDGPHLIVDVREPSEYLANHLANARNIPLTELGSALVNLGDASKLYFVCASGPRSQKACQLARELLPDIPSYWLEGGMRQFKLQRT